MLAPTRLLRRPLVSLAASVIVAAVTVGLSTGIAVAPAGAKTASSATCSQLTAKELQPLVSDPITKISTNPVDGLQYGQTGKKVGQVCTVATASTSGALTVTVIGGPAAARAWQGELSSLGGHVSVPGIGAKAARSSVDSDGSVGTAEVVALKGSTYCSVDPIVGDVPGGGALEEAAGATSAIGNQAYAIIAAADGTICNRIFGSGNTTPDLSKLASISVSAPSTTELGSGGLDVQK